MKYIIKTTEYLNKEVIRKETRYCSKSEYKSLLEHYFYDKEAEFALENTSWVFTIEPSSPGDAKIVIKFYQKEN